MSDSSYAGQHPPIFRGLAGSYTACVIQPAERPSLILLVDDFEDALEIYGQYLTFLGHRVVCARNGRDALNRAQAIRPDLILLDIGMAGISGIDVVRTLRADRRFVSRPIVALTARALENERVEALGAGFDEVIPKPCLPDQLAASVQRILRTKFGRPVHAAAASA